MPTPPSTPGSTPSPRPRLVAVSWARTVPVELLAPSLSAHDRARLGRLRRGGDLERSGSARVLLRAAVGAWTGTSAADVVIRAVCARCGSTDHGKPSIAATPEIPAPPHVSVAHADDVVVVAVTAAGPVGVDVEPVDAARFDGFDAVALSDVERATDRRRGTGAKAWTWVRKESVLKATGLGLTIDPRHIVVSAPDEPPRVTVPPSGDDPAWWQLRDVDLAPGVVCAVAVRTAPGGTVDLQVTELDLGSLTSGGSSSRNSHASNR